MACLAGLHDPFRKAEQILSELAGWSIDAETLRRHCHAEAAQARQQRKRRAQLPGQFAQATGDRELHLDAGKVNTPEGWRDVKVAVFACRERAPSASVDNYEQRDLPAPTTRSVLAEVEEVQAFGLPCQREAERLGVASGELSVLGDGAEWIWNLARQRFVGATEVLDIYHGIEHLAQAGRAALGEGAALTTWLQSARRQLIGDGYAGVCVALTQPLPEEQQQRHLEAMVAPTLNYFCGHQERLGYAVRLRRGQVIGSGLVEGTIKQRVNIRMKRSGARWRAGQVGPLVELMAMADSPEWSEYWAMAA
jgi:hypothetical protein